MNDSSPIHRISSDGLPELGGLSPRELFVDGLLTPASAKSWSPPPVEDVAMLLPQYRVESFIGRGGMGAVYKALHPALDRMVAIKLLPAEMATDELFIARFEREARMLAKLQHPHIVTIYDFGQTSEGHLYFVMEFVDGTDLARIIAMGKLNPAQALELTIQICEALHYAHGQRVVHRDIKPANVLITLDGRAKLADFGLARPTTEADHALTATNMVMGTPAYMAPEQHAGLGDHRADIYALGVMLYEMLTGTRPEGAFDLPSIKAHVDARLDEVVVKAMRQEPERRYQHVSEMQQAVDRIRSGPAPVMEREPAPKLPVERNGTWKAIGVLAAMTALLIGTYAWLHEGNVRLEPSSTIASAAIPESSSKTVSSESEPQQPVSTREGNSIEMEIKPAEPANTSPQSAAPPAASPPPAPEITLLDRFSQQAVTFTESALAPLERSIPADVVENVTLIRADLVDEGKTKPTASLDTYRSAYFLCQTLLNTLEERGKALISPAEHSAWSERSSILRQTLEAQYAQFRSVRLGTITFALITAPPPAMPVEKPVTSQIHALADQGPNIAAWIRSPLTVTVPEAIWENLNFLKEGLKDEAAQKPVANAASYALAVRYCITLLTFLEDRDQAAARAGGAAVLHQKSKLTQDQRDHLTWPQYMLEKDERVERKDNARTADRFQSGHSNVVWSTRSTTMRRDMQLLYSQLREALRQK